MRPRNTIDRDEVIAIYRWSLAQASAGVVVQRADADGQSPWHNAGFHDPASGADWIVYLPDHAWPGEVRVLASPVGPA